MRTTLLLIAVVFTLIGGGVVRAAATPARPNVLVIVADDLGYADTSCFGSKDIPTPNIDSLAKAGVRCTQAYVSAGSCSPSRAGIMTGRYQERFGFEFNCNKETANKQPTVVGLDPSAVTMADVLKKNGYVTGAVGKWHLGFDKTHHPQARGFDEFFGFLPGAHHYLTEKAPGVRAEAEGEKGASGGIMRGHTPVQEERYLTEAFAQEASTFIERNAEKPFFLYLAFNAVHTPFEATDPYVKRFEKVPDLRRRVYYAMVSAMDDAIGQVLGTLKKKGLDENTLIVFLSDNGGPTYTEVQNNGPLKLGKLYLFEGGVRVPMIFRWPGTLKPGSVNTQVMSGLDLFPTIAAATGSGLPPDMSLDGVNLLPHLKAETPKSPHEMLYWRNGTNRAIRKNDWKLVQAGTGVWLFDLAKDLGETTNLATQHPDVVKEMQAALSEWEKTIKPPAWPCRVPTIKVDVDGKPYELQI